MKLPFGVASFLAAALMFTGLVLSPPPLASTARAAGGSLDGEKQKGDQIVQQGGQLIQSLGVTELMGPLAPVALSPFFSLTVLSGASLAAEADWLPLPDAIKKNALLSSQSPLHNGLVFTGLLGLTLLTAAPKLTKVTKPLGQAIDQIEAHAGIIGVVAVQLLSQLKLGDAPPTETASVLIQAGFFSATQATIVSVAIAIASAINIFVINTVKFFFEVLVWLSPFPAVDAFFEAANKAFAGFLLAVYLWSPFAAAAINFAIFFVALVIFAWVHRRVVYMKSILSDPVLGWIGEKIFRRPPATVDSTPLPPSLRKRYPQTTLVLKAFSAQAFSGVKRKARGFLVVTADGTSFVAPRFLRSPIIAPLPRVGHRVTVEDGLLSNPITWQNDAGQAVARLLVTNRYNALLGRIEALLGDGRAPETRTAEVTNAVAAGRAAGAAAAAAPGRQELRAELA